MEQPEKNNGKPEGGNPYKGKNYPTEPARRKYSLKISPALIPQQRHQIENCLETLGYIVTGGGTDTDMSSCDISFYK